MVSVILHQSSQALLNGAKSLIKIPAGPANANIANMAIGEKFYCMDNSKKRIAMLELLGPVEIEKSQNTNAEDYELEGMNDAGVSMSLWKRFNSRPAENYVLQFNTIILY